MDLEKKNKLNELYSKAKLGVMIEQNELAFIPDILDRDFYYKDLLSASLNYRKANDIDYSDIEYILSGQKEKDLKIKELELELLKLRGE